MATAADRTQAKRARILEAARDLFLRHGLRNTTMEAIARAAQVAKPTLYAHFPDKDAVFLDILEALLRDKVAAFDAGLAGEGPVAERVGRAIAAEFAVLASALAGSPHAEELFAEHRRAADLFRASDAEVFGKLEAALGAAGIREPARLTRLLLDAAFGLAQRSIATRDLGDDLKLLARRLIAPELDG